MGKLKGNFNIKLTSLEEAIMLSILDTPRYGLDIVEVVSTASNGSYQIGAGTLYPALHRLKKRGLIQQEKVSKCLKIRRDHNRCYYQVTPEGKQVLDEIERIRLQIRAQPST